MVRQYYVDELTEFSEKELKRVLQTVERPVCLLGGWAVHLYVNEGFQQEHERSYIGSRDIDIGFHIEPKWSESELRKKSIGRSLEKIEELGYTRSRFGYSQYFHRDTRERLTEEEASELPLHQTFEVFIDIIPDTTKLDNFEEAFGFRPPAEKLLTEAFKESYERLSQYVEWGVPGEVIIPEPGLLAAMKIRSIPHRDKDHKRVKDIADLHSILWYVEEYNEIKDKTHSFISDSDLQKLDKNMDSEIFENAANLLQIDISILEDSVSRLNF